MADEQDVEMVEHSRWQEAAEATARGDEIEPAPDEAWQRRLRDSTLLVLAVVAHEHEASVRQIHRAVGRDNFPGALRLSLRKLKRLELIDCEHRPGHNFWYATPAGATLGVTPYVARLLGAVRPRYRTRPREGMSAARFWKVGSTHGPPIFSPAWTLADVTDPQVLADAIRNGTSDDREYALTKLVALRDPAGVDALREIVNEARGKDEDFARKAVVALASFDSPASVDMLIDIASHRDSLMREAAARGLGRLRAPAAIPTLVDLIDYPSEPVRAAAVTALGRIGERSSAAATAVALGDPHSEVRDCARQALIKLGASEPLKHNPRRLLPLRALDARRARAAVRHHQE